MTTETTETTATTTRLPVLAFATLFGLLCAAGCSPEARNFGGEGGAGGDTTGPGGGGAGGQSAGAGPQLVRSTPGDGETEASIEPYALLYFDRPVSFASAAGKIRASNSLVPDPAPLTTMSCPDADPTCVAIIYPDTFHDPAANGNRLPGGSLHTVVVDKSFADPDGNTNDLDQSTSYTTFSYDLRFVDDSAVVQEESGGLDYDPGTQALFACGLESFQNQSFIIRRIPLPGGVAGTPETATIVDTSNTGGPYTYGLDIYNGRMYVSGTYQSRVYEYGDITGALPTPMMHYQTGLPAPNDVLLNVDSTAVAQGWPLFGSRPYAGGPMDAVVTRTAAGGYVIWMDVGASFDISSGFTLAAGLDAPGGAEVVYVGIQGDGTILKIDAATKTIINQHVHEPGLYDSKLRVDSRGRLYVGTGGGVWVYDTAGTAGFTELAAHRGLDAGRIAIREEGPVTHVYFMRFRDPLRIGVTSFNLP